jgi:hypothetical protein
MKKLFATIAAVVVTVCVFAQAPLGMSYQAVIRNTSNVLVANQSVGMRISILQGSPTGIVVYEETYSPNPQTNANGLVTIQIGSGSIVAGNFSAINWSTGTYFIKTETDPAGGTNYSIIGTSQLLSVPYALLANNIGGALPYVNVTGNTPVMDSALFVVRNNIGQIIFAVYNEGVRIYVDDGKAKGTNKGGFAIGGFGTSKATSQEYFRVTRDSTRVYVNPNAKGTKGGFAIGGFSGAKGSSDNYLDLTPNNYFIGQGSGKNNTTGLYNSFFGYQAGDTNTTGSNNVFLGYQSGFNNDNGSANVFIGYESGENNLGGTFSYNGTNNVFIGSSAGFSNTTGFNNTFLGDEAGYKSNTGVDNVFLGDKAGHENTSGLSNIFLGEAAGNQNIDGQYNICIGSWAGEKQNTFNASRNIFLGMEAGDGNLSGSDNIFIGTWSGGGTNTTGSSNICVGTQSGFQGNGTENIFLGNNSGRYNAGTNNLFMGSSAGYASTAGSGNVFLGYHAGYNEKGSNKLYVANNETDSTLIYGDFSSKSIGVGTSHPKAILEVAVSGGDGYAGIGINSSRSGGKLITLNQGMAGRLNLTVPGVVDLATFDFINYRMGINNISPQYPLQVGTASSANGNGAYLTTGGTWTNGSSRTFKDRFASINGEEMIEKIMNLDVESWYYKNTDEFHIGPVAEDFYQLFGTGDRTSKEVSKYLSSSDVAGVSLVAVKQLIRKNQDQEEQIEKQQVEIDHLKSLENEVSELKILVNTLVANQTGQGNK